MTPTTTPEIHYEVIDSQHPNYIPVQCRLSYATHLYQQGTPMNTCHQKAGIGLLPLRKHLRDTGIQNPSPTPINLQIEIADEQYLHRKTPNELSWTYDSNPKTIIKYFKTHRQQRGDYTVNPEGYWIKNNTQGRKWSKLNIREIRECQEARTRYDVTWKELSQRYRVAVSTIRKGLKDYESGCLDEVIRKYDKLSRGGALS